MITETRNEKSKDLHRQSISEVLQLINEEDKTIATVVEAALTEIEQAVEIMIRTIENDGSIFYMGAGTSGRLGVLDASECPPTFGVSSEVVQGIIAGGDKALRDSIESAEDSAASGAEDVNVNVNPNDVVVGIASSGQTPYVLGAMKRAKELGIKTIGISCNEHTELSKEVDLAIELPVGAEIITGSTRLKAGTAQKMVLNMLSTTTMIKTGKVYENLMVNLKATNNKLRKRAISIIHELVDVSDEEANETFDKSNGDARVAILMLMFDVEREIAQSKIEKHKGNFVKALNELNETVK